MASKVSFGRQSFGSAKREAEKKAKIAEQRAQRKAVDKSKARHERKEAKRAGSKGGGGKPDTSFNYGANRGGGGGGKKGS